MQTNTCAAPIQHYSMGIRFTCPNGHKLHVKTFQAGRSGVCPHCGAKILVPSATPQSAAAAASANSAVSPAGGTGSPGDFASQSVVITVAESQPVVAPVIATPIAVSPPAPAASAAPDESITLSPVLPPTVGTTATPPLLPADHIGPISPAVQYVAKRERNRRNQFTMAILLLIAVVVLAAVLIWVLQRNAGQTPAATTQQSRIDKSVRSLYVATSTGTFLALTMNRSYPCE